MGRTKHGHASNDSESRAYMIWRQMRQRCGNPNNPGFANYGARGIKVSEAWASSFQTFLDDMGEPPPGMSLDRKDNDGDYCSENCRWATQSAQNKNSRQSRIIEFQGEALNVSDWEARLGLSQGALWHRLRLGWPLSKALTTTRAAA